MPSTGINNGTLVLIYVGGTAVAKTTTASMNFNNALRETTTKASGGYEESLGGKKSGTVDVEALFAEDAAYGFTDLFTAWAANTVVTLKYSSEVSGDKKYSASALVQDLTRNAPVEDNENYSASFKLTGTITEGTIT